MQHSETIVILDFGSQFTQLIARRIREMNVYCEIHPFNTPLDKIRSVKPVGIILSGGPSSVYDDKAPLPDVALFEMKLPVLGICYGMQVMAHYLGGKVDKAAHREYGRAEIRISDHNDLFKGFPSATTVWQSHGDLGFGAIPSRAAYLAAISFSRIRTKWRAVFGLKTQW